MQDVDLSRKNSDEKDKEYAVSHHPEQWFSDLEQNVLPDRARGKELCEGD
ncbi:TPA: hypothetical protein TXJ16_000414 [Streptococcus suis]|nr:hypothetical protein [Streptococcus suis]